MKFYCEGLFTRNVFYPVSVIITVKVQHYVNGDGVNNGWTHFSVILMTIKITHLITETG